MATYKVIVDLLNKRREPVPDMSSKLNVAGQVKLNDIIEGHEDAELDNGKWIRDLEGYYYWSAGLEEMHAEIPASPAANSYFALYPKLTNWNENIPQIPKEWRDSKGNGIKVAILDTGVLQDHEDLKNAIFRYEDFTPFKDNIDYNGHGSHLAGIIAGKSDKVNGIIGVAPLAELIVLKVLHDSKDGTMTSYQPVIDALDRAADLGADIINMSFSLKEGQDPLANDVLKTTLLRDKIREIAARNIILVGAAGDNGDLEGNQLLFPAACDDVISVVSINDGYFSRHSDYNKKICIIGPYIDYQSTYKSPAFYKNLMGCSMTAAFVSGIIALALSASRKAEPGKRFSRAEILSMLKAYSRNVDSVDYTDNSRFYFSVQQANGVQHD
jgi:subtilisin family serine protease